MWNVLPLKVRQASNISNFKKGEGTSCYQDMTKPSIFYIILVLTILIHFAVAIRTAPVRRLVFAIRTGVRRFHRISF